MTEHRNASPSSDRYHALRDLVARRVAQGAAAGALAAVTCLSAEAGSLYDEGRREQAEQLLLWALRLISG